MKRLFGMLLCMGIFFGGLGVPDAGHAQSWRNLKPFPASSITWEKGFIGIVGQDKTRFYHLTGRGGLGVPFLGPVPREKEMMARAAYIKGWLERHPNAVAMPVEAYPFFSKTVCRVYIWIVDGSAHLNLDLVREGFIEGSFLMTNLRHEDLYITAKQVWELRSQAAAAEIEAARACKGIWADPEYQEANPPGKLEYPNNLELSRFEKAAAEMPDPSPSSGKEGK